VTPPRTSGGGAIGMLADRAVSAVIGALGVYVIIESTTFDLGTVAGPWLVPMIVGIVLVVLGAWGVVRPERSSHTWFRIRPVQLVVTAGALAAYVFLMPVVGFLAATIALSIVLSLPGELQTRMRILVCVAGTVATVGLYLLFVNVFNVPLPGPVWAS
jgi:tripartite tricarboxylate transporter TctB family protein